jgi:nucleoside-diphosphate-sugar epimerase
MSVGEIIDIIQSAAGTSLEVACDNQVRSNELFDVYADISKAASGLGWRPQVSFWEGVGRVLDSGDC